MYYKYTIYSKPKHAGLIEFQPWPKDMESVSDLVEPSEAFKFLGYIREEDGRTSGYYYVKDGVEPVDQPAEINAYSLESLPEDVAQKLFADGAYMKHKRYMAAIQMLPPIYAGHEIESLFAQTYTDMAGLAAAVEKIISMMPSTMAEDQTAELRHARNTLSRFSKYKTNEKAATDAVGL